MGHRQKQNLIPASLSLSFPLSLPTRPLALSVFVSLSVRLSPSLSLSRAISAPPAPCSLIHTNRHTSFGSSMTLRFVAR